MDEPRQHLKTPEEIERTCVPGLVEVLRAEGIEGLLEDVFFVAGRSRSVSRR